MSGLIDVGIQGKTPNWLGLVEAGMDARRKYDAREAFGALVTDPQNPQAFATLARADSELAYKWDGNRQKVAREARVSEMSVRAAQGDRQATNQLAGLDSETWGRISTQQREAIKTQNAWIGQMAYAADTPEKWASVVQQAQARGIDTSQYQDFSTRNAVLADAQMLDDVIKAAQPKAPDYVFDSESGSWLQKPGTGSPGFGGGVPAAPAQGMPAQGGGGGTFDRMINAESGGRQYTGGRVTESPKGALGIAQIMPATAPEAAALAGVPYDAQRLRTDAAYNRQLGEAYYNRQLETFQGDEAKAAAAYNAGPGRVRQAIERGGENWLRYVPEETRNYVAKVTGGGAMAAASPVPMEGAQAPQGQGNPAVINVRPPKSRERDAPSQNTKQAVELRKGEALQRKEFDLLPEVKDFRTMRSQFNALRTNVIDQEKRVKEGKPPSATADIALVFNFMKMLDPTSVVREGEYATAKNAAGVPEQVRNAYNKAKDGTFLARQQRRDFLGTAFGQYKSQRDIYNERAESFRGYARDGGLNPDRVARTYTPDKPQASSQVSPTITRMR